MRKITTCMSVLAALLLVGCGGGDTAQSISKEIMANFHKMADILESVSDEASAKAAVPKIEAVRASMRDIAKRAKSVKTDAAGEKAMAELQAKEMGAVQARMGAAMAKLMTKPEIMKILGPAMENMGDDL